MTQLVGNMTAMTEHTEASSPTRQFAPLAIILGILAMTQNVAFLVSLAFAVAASANLPTILYSLYWKRFNTTGAVASIYAAKGRPSFNPLIAHVATLEAARREGLFDEAATRLAEAFWPGPLTLVLPVRGGAVTTLATAGLDTVAVRVPAHRAMQAVLEVDDAAPPHRVREQIPVERGVLGQQPIECEDLRRRDDLVEPDLSRAFSLSSGRSPVARYLTHTSGSGRRPR